jgi:Ion channel
MILQIAIGTAVIIVNAVIQAEMFSYYSRRMEKILLYLRYRFRRFANTAAIVTGVLFVMLVHSIQVWIWAHIFQWVGAFSDMEPALYFSLVSFSTVGFGDITLGPDWRLLSALAAANGFISFGWSTAYMVELVRRTA